MTTTIQISDTTKQILEHLKREENVSSYDIILENILKKHIKVPHSMFASIKGIRWKKEDRADI